MLLHMTQGLGYCPGNGYQQAYIVVLICSEHSNDRSVLTQKTRPGRHVAQTVAAAGLLHSSRPLSYLGTNQPLAFGWQQIPWKQAPR